MIFPFIKGIQKTGQLEKAFKRYLIIFCPSVLAGVIMGIFVVGVLPNIPSLYILLGLGGLLFAYLLLFHIEVAVILALLVFYETSRFNYLGGGTPYHPNGLLGIGIIGATIFYFLFHRINFSRLLGIKPFIGYLLVCIFSLAFSGRHLMDGLTITLRLATALSIYSVLIYKLDSIKIVNWVIFAVAGSQIVRVLTKLLNLPLGNISASENGEPTRIGDSGVGAFLALILTLSIIQFINSKKTSERLLWGGMVGLFGIGLFFSFGRSGWIGFAVAMVVIGLMKYKKLLLILPILIILLVVLVPAIPQRFSDISVDALTYSSTSTLAGRIYVWKGAIDVAKNHLFFGVGYGVGRYRVGELLGQYSYMIHNDYLSVLLETGLLGLIVFIFWHSQWLISILKVFLNSKYEYDKILVLGIFAIFAASLVIRITENILQDAYKLYYLSALVAVAFALPRVRANEEAKAPFLPEDEEI